MSEWIRVEDRLPEYGQQVLVFDNVEGCFDIWILDLEEDGCIEDITYWMPLPEPPGEDCE